MCCIPSGWSGISNRPGVLYLTSAYQQMAGSQDWQAEHRDDGTERPEGQGALVFNVCITEVIELILYYIRSLLFKKFLDQQLFRLVNSSDY